MKALLTLAAIVALTLTGCGQKDNVSFNTLEEAKNTARDNSLFNAQRFRAENPDVKDFSVTPNGDSSQTPDCPQGDGWATLKMFSPDSRVVVEIKCSTYSAATQCLRTTDFKTKPFAGQDNHCQPTTLVPFPLPKIAK